MQWLGRTNASGQYEPWLEREAEAALVLRFRDQGDTQARDTLVRYHLRMARSFARHYARHGSSFDDLVQEASLALLRAAESFDPGRSVRFSTYAAYWIRARLQRAVAKWRSHAYTAPAYLAYATNASKVAGRAQNLRPTLSLDAPADNDGGASLADKVPTTAESVEQQVAGREARTHLRRAMAKAIDQLGDARVTVLCQRRLLSEEPVTLEVLGEELHLSREGVRNLETKLVRQIKKALREQAA